MTGRQTAATAAGISRRRALGWTARGGAALAAAALLGRKQGEVGTVSAQSALGIAGSWMLTILDDAAPDQAQVSLVTFTDGGGYIEASSPGQSTGQGTWAQNADGSIGLTFVQLGYGPMTGAPGGPSGPQVVLTVVASIQLGADNNSFSARYRYSAALPNGNPVPAGAGGGQPTSGTGTANGTRIQVQAL